MNAWTVYTLATGRLEQQLVDSNGPLDDIQPGEFFVSGHHDTKTKYVVNDTVINRPVMPLNIVSLGGVNTTDNFRVENIPTDTVVEHNGTVETITTGFIEFTETSAMTYPVTFTKFPYLERVLQAEFT